MKHAIALAPLSARAHINLATNIYSSEKKYQSAITSLLEALVLEPTMPEAHINLALMYGAVAATADAILHLKIEV